VGKTCSQRGQKKTDQKIKGARPKKNPIQKCEHPRGHLIFPGKRGAHETRVALFGKKGKPGEKGSGKKRKGPANEKKRPLLWKREGGLAYSVSLRKGTQSQTNRERGGDAASEGGERPRFPGQKGNFPRGEAAAGKSFPLGGKE